MSQKPSPPRPLPNSHFPRHRIYGLGLRSRYGAIARCLASLLFMYIFRVALILFAAPLIARLLWLIRQCWLIRRHNKECWHYLVQNYPQVESDDFQPDREWPEITCMVYQNHLIFWGDGLEVWHFNDILTLDFDINWEEPDQNMRPAEPNRHQRNWWGRLQKIRYLIVSLANWQVLELRLPKKAEEVDLEIAIDELKDYFAKTEY